MKLNFKVILILGFDNVTSYTSGNYIDRTVKINFAIRTRYGLRVRQDV